MAKIYGTFSKDASKIGILERYTFKVILYEKKNYGRNR